MADQDPKQDQGRDQDAAERELGERIAAFRQLRGMSLRAVAAAAGVSSSFLSQLENGRTNASVASLRKIAVALGVSPAQLLDDSAAHTRGVLRAADRTLIPLEGAEKFIVSLPPLRNLEVYAGRFQPGGTTGAEPYVHGTSQELFIVTAGEIVLELGAERYTMRTDDSIEFLSSTPHRVLNESDAEASVLWINSPPTPDESPHLALHQAPGSGSGSDPTDRSAHADQQ